jgi:hypothetical protein
MWPMQPACFLFIVFRIPLPSLKVCCTSFLHYPSNLSSLPFSTIKFRNFLGILSRNNNKMQLCNRIYYSKIFWRLNMFRAAHRSSLGALNCICSLWFICPYGDRPLPRLSGKCHFPLSFGNGRSPYRHINQRLQIQFRAPDDERCAARNMLSLP